MMRACCNCNKEVKSSRHCCYVCGKPLCAGCRNSKMLCSDCFVQSNEANIINEYFKEKYEMRDTIKC